MRLIQRNSLLQGAYHAKKKTYSPFPCDSRQKRPSKERNRRCSRTSSSRNVPGTALMERSRNRPVPVLRKEQKHSPFPEHSRKIPGKFPEEFRNGGLGSGGPCRTPNKAFYKTSERDSWLVNNFFYRTGATGSGRPESVRSESVRSESVRSESVRSDLLSSAL